MQVDLFQLNSTEKYIFQKFDQTKPTQFSGHPNIRHTNFIKTHRPVSDINPSAQGYIA